MKFKEQKIDEIRGKMLVSAASQEEVSIFLHYVSILEGLVTDASNEDFFGTEGWHHLVFTDTE